MNTLINEKKKSRLLSQISNTMYKVYTEDLEDFIAYCEAINIKVDSSHLEHDGCLSIEDNLGVEVLEDY